MKQTFRVTVGYGHQRTVVEVTCRPIAATEAAKHKASVDLGWPFSELSVLGGCQVEGETEPTAAAEPAGDSL